jgi:hypothetical protein
MAARYLPFVAVVAAATGGCRFDSAGTDTDAPLDLPPRIDSGVVITDSAIGDDAPSEDTDRDDTGLAVDSVAPEDVALDTADATPLMCTTGELPFGGHCYFLDLTPRTFLDARNACTAEGAHLVTINSYEEDTFAASITIGLEAWMGLTRDPPSNPKLRASFKWITGEPMLVDAWRGSEPDGSGQCARRTGTGWADAGCAETFVAICERE